MSQIANHFATKVGVNFVHKFYTTVVEHPDKLPAFYSDAAKQDQTPDYHSAKPGDSLVAVLSEKSALLGAITAVRVNKIHAIPTSDNSFLLNVEGVMITSATAAGGTAEVRHEHDFIQKVELLEIQANFFTIVKDEFAFVLGGAFKGSALQQHTKNNESHVHWALDTPPMFAVAPDPKKEESLEGLQQPHPTNLTATEPTSVPTPPEREEAVRFQQEQDVDQAAVKTEAGETHRESSAPKHNAVHAEGPEKKTNSIPHNFASRLRAKATSVPSQGHSLKKTVAVSRVSAPATPQAKAKETLEKKLTKGTVKPTTRKLLTGTVQSKASEATDKKPKSTKVSMKSAKPSVSSSSVKTSQVDHKKKV